MVVGQYGTVHVFHAGQKLLSLLRIYLGALHYKPQMPVRKTKQYWRFPSMLFVYQMHDMRYCFIAHAVCNLAGIASLLLVH